MLVYTYTLIIRLAVMYYTNNNNTAANVNCEVDRITHWETFSTCKEFKMVFIGLHTVWPLGFDS